MLIENWPFETLLLSDYLIEAYSGLLLFYKTDINSFIGKIAPEILKWFLIGAKYTKMLISESIINQGNSNCRIRLLDITGLPVSDHLVKILLEKYSNSLSPIFCTEDSSNTDSDDSNSSDTFIVSYSNEDSESNSQSEEASSQGSSQPDLDLRVLVDKYRTERLASGDHKRQNFVIKLDLILDSYSLLEKYLKILELKQNCEIANCGFELNIDKIELTIHDQKYCVQSSCLDNEALVNIIFF